MSSIRIRGSASAATTFLAGKTVPFNQNERGLTQKNFVVTNLGAAGAGHLVIMDADRKWFAAVFGQGQFTFESDDVFFVHNPGGADVSGIVGQGFARASSPISQARGAAAAAGGGSPGGRGPGGGGNSPHRN